MTRKNEDRFGIDDLNTAADASAAAVSAPIPTPTQQASPLSFVAPTEFVELPSRGKFYAEEHPLHNKTIIEIKQMTTKEEDILTSETLLKKGVAINRMVGSLLLDKNIKRETKFRLSGK